MQGWRIAVRGLAAVVLAACASASAAENPSPPYWSVELGRYATREQALAEMRKLPADSTLRAEQRAHGWYVRDGAWAEQAKAESAKKGWAERGVKARVLHVEHAVPWVVATAPAPVVTPVTPPHTAAAPAPAKATRPVPAAPVKAATPATSSGGDLTSLDLEQLLAVQVTGVTGRSGSYLQSPAAIFVLTGEDIRRSGVRTIAEALRLVPGLQVYRSNAQNYTVTSRGFGADKLQVLVDGYSAYSPLSSTVYWDTLDTYLEDIARIEVIRGPGATIWGANAVNGVINIVTKSASDTTGTHAFGGGGNQEKAFGGFRSGGRLGEFGEGRVYVQGAERAPTEHPNGRAVIDGASSVQAGARVDGSLGDWGRLTLNGDAYRERIYSATFPANKPADGVAEGRDVGARWSHPWSDGSETVTSFYYDGYNRDSPTIYSETRDTYDLNIQHNLAAIGEQRLTGGLAGRISHDDTGGPPLLIVWQPPSRTLHTYSAFLQDEIAFGSQWSLLVGSKFEHNDYTGFEYEPTWRLGWAVTPETYTWLAVSRATRTPNRVDHDIGIACTGAGAPIAQCTTAGTVISIGSPIDSENLLAYEWGLRSQFMPELVGDLSLFANDYTKLRTTEGALMFANGAKAWGYGGEATTSWRVTDWASLSAFYSYVLIDAKTEPGSTDTTTVATLEKGTPRNSAGLRASVQAAASVSVDSFLRYVDNVPAQNVPAYTELNLRLGWQPRPQLELSLIGENLLDDHHPETGAAASRSEIARSVFANLTLRLW